MSLKTEIEAAKVRIADAYTAIVAKGGTLPATQDSANLPAAIASIPSGGASGLFYELEQYGVPSEMIAQANLSMWERDLQASLPLGTRKNVPFVACPAVNTDRYFQGYNNMRYCFLTSGVYNTYLTFYNCSNLELIVFSPSVTIVYFALDYLAFANCGKLRAILGVIFEADNMSQTFSGTTGIEEVYIKWTGNSATWMRPLTRLRYECVLFTIQNLSTTPSSGATFTIGQANIDKLNATQEGQDAIAAATANGWTIAA